MRIGVNTLFLIPGEVGGSETYLRRLLPEMAAAGPDNRLVLFTNSNDDAVLRADLAACPNVEFAPLRLDARNRYARIVLEQTELPWRARRAGIDVLWSPGYTSPLFTACPRVTSILDVQYKSHPEDLTPMALLTTGILVPLAAWRSRRVIAISEFARREVIEKLGTPSEKVGVTPLAVDPVYGVAVDPEERRRRVEAALGVRGPYLLAVSNTYPHKNLDVAVAAFGSIMGRIPHELAVVGRPRRGEKAVQKAIAALPDPARVKRAPYLSGDDLVCAYQGADVFVFPSVYEGFGLPVLEAMMAGTPVVAGRCASIPELGGEAVAYADPRAAGDIAAGIESVLAWSDDERRARTDTARRRAATFTWQRTAKATIEVLREAV
jgi:glycosyltransferase involved in cell wall biosynthesis